RRDRPHRDAAPVRLARRSRARANPGPARPGDRNPCGHGGTSLMSHHVTHASVSAWLAAYLHAWETYDPAEIGALFTEDADARGHPADEREKGRKAIVDAWLNPGGNASSRDEPGTYAGDLHPFVGNGNR